MFFFICISAGRSEYTFVKMKMREIKTSFIKKYGLKFWHNWKIYTRNLTMHGAMYFSESKSIIELIFWLLVIILCFALCIWLMLIHWFR